MEPSGETKEKKLIGRNIFCDKEFEWEDRERTYKVTKFPTEKSSFYFTWFRDKF